MIEYILILGKTPYLSLLELVGWAESRQINLHITRLSAEVVRVSGLSEQQVYALSGEVGGVVKVGRVLKGIQNLDQISDQLSQCVLSELDSDVVTFGISWHPNMGQKIKPKEIERIGLTVKKNLKKFKRRVRFVQAEELELTSVQVEKNGLVAEKGIELLVLHTAQGLILGRTLVVQPYEDWSKRDYGRPGRDAKSGMLPPKLARMMVNMLGMSVSGKLLDPFCGSGTIITEAAMVGWRKQIASDQSARAIKDTLRNLEWLQQEYKIEVDLKVHQVAINELSSVVKSASIHAVVTEGYLGSALHKPARLKDIEKHQAELVPIYRTLLRELTRVLVDGGRAVIVMPRWIDTSDQEHALMKLRGMLPPGLKTRHPLDGKISSSETAIYRRPGQYVVRELVLLERKPRHQET